MRNGKTVLTTLRYAFMAVAAAFIIAFPTALLLYNVVPATALSVVILLGCYTVAVAAFYYVIRNLRHAPDEDPDNIVRMPKPGRRNHKADKAA